MNWYVAKIVYQIICGRGMHTAQFDEQLRLVNAENSEEAFEKAIRLGVAEQEVFCNDKHELVQWRFVNVAELLPLTNLTHGAEVYSRIREEEDAAEYIRSVELRAAAIGEKLSFQPLQLV